MQPTIAAFIKYNQLKIIGHLAFYWSFFIGGFYCFAVFGTVLA